MKIAEVDQKWSDCFKRLEALLIPRTLEPTFSSTVKVMPTHSPPAGAVKSTDPFIRPTESAIASSSEFPRSDFSAAKHQSTSKTQLDRPGSTSSKCTGADFSAAKHQSTSKLQSSQPHTDQPTSSDLTGTDSPYVIQAVDNPFASPKTPVSGKVSVQIPTEDWLCRKLSKLNTTLVEGYPSHSSEAGGLLKDQFLRPAKSQAKWYRRFSNQKVDPPDVSS